MTNGDWVSTTRLGVAGLRVRCSTGRTSFTTVVDGKSLNRAEWTWLSRTGEGRCSSICAAYSPSTSSVIVKLKIKKLNKYY